MCLRDANFPRDALSHLKWFPPALYSYYATYSRDEAHHSTNWPGDWTGVVVGRNITDHPPPTMLPVTIWSRPLSRTSIASWSNTTNKQAEYHEAHLDSRAPWQEAEGI